MSDARKESSSPKGDEQSYLEEDMGDKEVMGFVEEERAAEEKLGFAAEEEPALSKEDVSMAVETQGSPPAETSLEDRPLESNDGPIQEFVVVVATKK